MSFGRTRTTCNTYNGSRCRIGEDRGTAVARTRIAEPSCPPVRRRALPTSVWRPCVGWTGLITLRLDWACQGDG